MINIQDIFYQYGSTKPLFEGLDLNLPAGNIYGLLGKNGAGKSTLLKLISGLLFPKQGQLEVVGHKPQDRNPDFLKEVFLITEEFHLPSMDIPRYIKFYSPFYPRFSHEALHSYMTEFSLPQDQKLDTFSYGQKKKFLVSFGLATDSKLLILDEPTNGLDIPSKSQFRKVVASALHEDRSFIISTHQARDMENLIDPIVILDEGKIVFFSDLEETSKKLTVTKTVSPDEETNVVYAEPGFGSFTVVKENTSGEETSINLEMLFNAVVNNKEKIHQIFGKKK